MTSQFLKFLMTGGIAALVNLGSRFVLDLWLSFEVAVILAYLIGMLTAYLLARRFVFAASERSAGSEFSRFALVNAVAMALVFTISTGLARVVFPALSFTWHADDIAHLIGISVPAVTSYIGHRWFTFARTSR